MEIAKSLKDGVYEVTLSGKFTFFDHAAFREIVDAISHADTHQIVLDMAGVTFIDSAGLGQLLLAHDEAEKHRKPLILRGAAGQVKNMFNVAHFETLFTLQD